MNRRIAVIGGVSLCLLLLVITVAILTRENVGSKVTVSFVAAETSSGPPFSNVQCERLAFAVRNDGTIPLPFVVSDIKDEHGNWSPSFHVLGDAEAGQTTHLYLYLPKGSHPQALRMRGYEPASTVQKAQLALKLQSEKASGRYPGKQVWLEKLTVPTYEFIVIADKGAEQTK